MLQCILSIIAKYTAGRGRDILTENVKIYQLTGKFTTLGRVLI